MLTSAPQPVNLAMQETFFDSCEPSKASDTIGAKIERRSIDGQRKESGCH
jgi:hypothetical protein